MKIVLISNFLNHYQESLASSFMKLPNCIFYFVATEKIPEDRISLGFDEQGNERKYVIKAYENEQKMINLLKDCDVLVTSWDGRKYLEIYNGLHKKKENIGNVNENLSFIYTERIFKPSGACIETILKNKLRKAKFRYYINRYTDRQTKYLCIGDYAVRDYMKIGVSRDKIYKFAYFPSVGDFERKYVENNVVKCLWAGRLLEWKKPADAIIAVSKLIKEEFPIELTIIGNGEEESKLKKLVSEQGTEGKINFTGSLRFDKVREYMRMYDVFLFTSTEAEGWGATLNEAMSEGMAVIAADGAGATSYLISDGVNGAVYKSGNVVELYGEIKKMLLHRDLIKKYGVAGNKTIKELWNPDQASCNFVQLALDIKENREVSILEGPCSKA